MIIRVAAAVVLAAACLAGCGNAVEAHVNGRTGISVDAEGNPVVVLAVCSEFVDQVVLSLGREGLSESEANPEVGTWRARDHVTGSARLELAAPDASWETHEPLSLDPQKHYIANASQADADVETAQVDFFGRDLAEMAPDSVYVSSGDADTAKLERHDAETFEAFACEG